MATLVRMAGVVALAIATSASAQSPSVYLFDVMRRPAYQRAYAAMVRSEHGLPSWMATPGAVARATASPGKLQSIGGESAETFSACKPHWCDESRVVVLFTGVGGEAKAALQDNGHVRMLGGPSGEESALLLHLLPDD